MRVGKLPGLVVASCLTLGLVTASAGADPNTDETFPLVCDNGHTYTVSTAGNGDFTPAHDVNSTAMLIPLSFGEFTSTVTFPDGHVETFTDPPQSKGQSGKNAKNTTSCSFTFSGTEDGVTFAGGGTVVGYVTPRRGA